MPTHLPDASHYSNLHTFAVALAKNTLIRLIMNVYPPSPKTPLHASIAPIASFSSMPPAVMQSGAKETLRRGQYSFFFSVARRVKIDWIDVLARSEVGREGSWKATAARACFDEVRRMKHGIALSRRTRSIERQDSSCSSIASPVYAWRRPRQPRNASTGSTALWSTAPRSASDSTRRRNSSPCSSFEDYPSRSRRSPSASPSPTARRTEAASNHIVIDKSKLENYEPYITQVKVADQQSVNTVGWESLRVRSTVNVVTHNIISSNILYIPKFANLISIGRPTDRGAHIVFNKHGCFISMKGQTILQATSYRRTSGDYYSTTNQQRSRRQLRPHTSRRRSIRSRPSTDALVIRSSNQWNDS
jgi:hypothetical protein